MSTADDATTRAHRILDTLHLELLDLIEQHTRCQLAIEDAVVSGQLLVAKTRYTLGKNAVTTAQLPTEHSAEFEALARVDRRRRFDHITDLVDGTQAPPLELRRSVADKEAGRPDPLKWFGILLPQSMQQAQRRYEQAVERSVECANIALAMQGVMQSILNVRSRLRLAQGAQ